MRAIISQGRRFRRRIVTAPELNRLDPNGGGIRNGFLWQLLGQQVFFSQRDSAAGAVQTFSMDGWDGYAASRRRITQGWVDADVRNAVVLTGDVHRNWANDLKVDYKDPASPVVGSELVCTSITSTGNGTGSTTLT